MTKSQKTREYQRFGVVQRIEHVILILSFSTLALTGLVQLFPAGRFSHWFVFLVGGIWVDRTIHRTAAVTLVLEGIFHGAWVGYGVFVLRRRPTMLPGAQDARAAWGRFLFNLGLRKERPLEGRYSFVEKAEYWALIWGATVMALTGFMLWNPVTVARVLPGRILPAAELAHGAEAVLAVAAIVLWHFYHSHVKVFNKSIFTGRITEEELADEHPTELADIKSGRAQFHPVHEEIRRRRRVYLPVAITVAIVLVAALYWATVLDKAFTTNPPPLEPGQALVEPPAESAHQFASFTPPAGTRMEHEGQLGPAP